MSAPGAAEKPSVHEYILVTGANAGLGLATCQRLIDEFLDKSSQNAQLTLIITTRTARKSEETVKTLQSHLHKHAQAGASPRAVKEKIHLQTELLDLSSLASVRACARRLNNALPYLSVAILNAGIGGWIDMDWARAVYTTLTDTVQAVTWPSFKLAPAGLISPRQTSLVDEPVLGSVFCSNVFGHYLLVHGLLPLLRSPQLPEPPSRIIWISSIEACTHHFTLSDLQALHTASPYESSKRLTDILVLTSNLLCTAHSVKNFLTHSTSTSASRSQTSSLPPQPTQHVCQPGISATSIFLLPLPLTLSMHLTFHVSRLLGSPWHTISPYLGAAAPSFLALCPRSTLDTLDSAPRRALWGSITGRLGRQPPGVDGLRKTWVDDWGTDGTVPGGRDWWCGSRGRKTGAKDSVTEEDIQTFEEVGRRAWAEMERLRVQWEELLDREEEQQKSKK